MIRRSVLGSFVPGDTPLHRADARVKVGLLLLSTVAAFGARDAAGLCLVTLALAAALVASRTRPSQVARGLRPAAVVLVFSLLANSVVLVGQPGFSLAGFERGATAVWRIALVVGFSLVFTATTMPPAIADALSSLMRPLRRLGVPVGDIATVISVALRFVPLTAEEVDRVRCAQRARGARLDEGGLSERLRAWGTVLVPVLVGLFRRADELARAMEDRCYTGEGRTHLAERVAGRDVALVALGTVWTALALAV